MSTDKIITPLPEQEVHLTDWHELPRIELYMDQVVSILQEEMRGLWIHADEAKVSASMVNNYVKVKLVPAPHKKRYERQHICALLIVFTLKSVLSMQELAELMPDLMNEFNGDMAKLHQAFISHLHNAIENKNTVEDTESNYETVLKHAVQAFAKRRKAQRLLSQLSKIK